MWKCLVATVALLVAVAKSVSLDNDVDQSQSKMLLQHVKRDTDTCQGLGDDCKKPHAWCEDAACAQQDCCEGLACKFKGDREKGVCKKDYLDYDNKCTTKAGASCVKEVECPAGFWPHSCTHKCCKGLTCSAQTKFRHTCQPVKEETCQGLGDDCKKPIGHDSRCSRDAVCAQQDCCEGLACRSKGDGEKGVCKKDYLDYDNKCTKAGGLCVHCNCTMGGVVCDGLWPAPCKNFCCKGLTCSSNVCK